MTDPGVNSGSHICKKAVSLLPGTDRYIHSGVIHCSSVVNGFGAAKVYNIGFVVAETSGSLVTSYFPQYSTTESITANSYVAYALGEGVVTMNSARFAFNLISKVEEGEMSSPNDPVYYATVCLRKFYRYSSYDGPQYIYYQKSAPITYDSGNVVISFDEPFSVKIAVGECLVASVLLASVNAVAGSVKSYDNITFSFDLASSLSS